MASPVSAPEITEPGAIPASLLNLCFVLFVINAVFFLTAFFAHWWIFDEKGLGIPTDFVNVWSAGKLVLEGHPAQAWDWDIQKQVQVAVLGQSYKGNFAWHYPPPFLFVAGLLAHFPYAVAFIGWAAVSLVPYLAVMRAIVGRPFGLLLALAFPVVLTNTLVGQNGFLTASLIGGTLYLMPVRPVLSGICLGLLSYKPQYGLLFPLVLIAASQWTVFFTAGAVAVDGARIMARLRYRELAGVLSLDADVLAGLPHRGPRALGQDAKHFRGGAVFRRHRADRLAVPMDHERHGRGRADAGVAQPYHLPVKGCRARDRHIADHAIPVSLRPDGAGDCDGVPGPDRIEEGL